MIVSDLMPPLGKFIAIIIVTIDPRTIRFDEIRALSILGKNPTIFDDHDHT